MPQRHKPQPSCRDSGLGEIMSLQQMRHSKFWFAGSAGNCPFAAYELDELKEGFDDVYRFVSNPPESCASDTMSGRHTGPSTETDRC